MHFDNLSHSLQNNIIYFLLHESVMIWKVVAVGPQVGRSAAQKGGEVSAGLQVDRSAAPLHQ